MENTLNHQNIWEMSANVSNLFGILTYLCLRLDLNHLGFGHLFGFDDYFGLQDFGFQGQFLGLLLRLHCYPVIEKKKYQIKNIYKNFQSIFVQSQKILCFFTWSVMEESPSLASFMVPLHWLMILDRTIVLLALEPKINSEWL